MANCIRLQLRNATRWTAVKRRKSLSIFRRLIFWGWFQVFFAQDVIVRDVVGLEILRRPGNPVFTTHCKSNITFNDYVKSQNDSSAMLFWPIRFPVYQSSHHHALHFFSGLFAWISHWIINPNWYYWARLGLHHLPLSFWTQLQRTPTALHHRLFI